MDLPRLTLLLAIVGSSAGLAQAQTSKPLKADDAACRQALDQLYSREEAQRAARLRDGGTRGTAAGPRNALDVARRQAAKACLGGASDQALASPRAQFPLSVTPITPPVEASSPSALRQASQPTSLGQLIPPTGSRQTAPPLRPQQVPASPPLETRPPLSRITSCDPAGCWNSEGQYLMRSGPNLAGPPGLCTSQAGILTCR